jgi:hypothetical protein
MWAHYASSHSGVCIGFDTCGVLFPRASAPVRYSNVRPKVNASSLLNASQGALPHEALSEILLTKGQFWAYEREWRFLGWHPVDNFHSRGGEWIEVDRRIIREVIFGVRCADETQNFVEGLLLGMPARPATLHAQRMPSKYAIALHALARGPANLTSPTSAHNMCA